MKELDRRMSLIGIINKSINFSLPIKNEASLRSNFHKSNGSPFNFRPINANPDDKKSTSAPEKKRTILRMTDISTSIRGQTNREEFGILKKNNERRPQSTKGGQIWNPPRGLLKIYRAHRIKHNRLRCVSSVLFGYADVRNSWMHFISQLFGRPFNGGCIYISWSGRIRANKWQSELVGRFSWNLLTKFSLWIIQRFLFEWFQSSHPEGMFGYVNYGDRTAHMLSERWFGRKKLYCFWRGWDQSILRLRDKWLITAHGHNIKNCRFMIQIHTDKTIFFS